MIRKTVRVILLVLASAVGLLLLLSVLVYVPAVQSFIKGRAISYVRQNMGVELSIERFRLKFPLRLSIDNSTLVRAQGDTLAGFGRFEVGVRVLPLFAGKIEVGRLDLRDATLHYSDTVSKMTIRSQVGEIAIHDVGVGWGQQNVDIGRIEIGDAVVDLFLGDGSQQADTTSSSPMLWKISAGQIDLDRVRFVMNRSPQTMSLDAALDKGRINYASVDFGAHEVNAKTVRLDGGKYGFFTDTVTVAQAARPDSLSSESLPWTVRAGSVELADNAFDYGIIYGSPAAGFDPDHIALMDINLRVDSVYNRSADVSGVVLEMAARERSGLQIVSGEGRFSMDSARIALGGFDLRTANSRIRADAYADATIMQLDDAAAIKLYMDASIGAADIFMFYPADQAMRSALRSRRVNVNTDIGGMLGQVNIRRFTASVPGALNINADGNVRSLTDLDRLAGNMRFDGNFNNIGFVKEFIADTALRNRIGLADRLSLSGRFEMNGSDYSIPGLVVLADSGRIELNGRVNTVTEIYRVDLLAEDFPLAAFLPTDSLGVLTMTLNAEGSGFDLAADRSALNADLNISRFDFRGHMFSDIAIDARLADHMLNAVIASGHPGLDLIMKIDGSLYQDKYEAALRADINELNVEELGFSQTPLAMTGMLKIDAGMRTDGTSYRAKAMLDSAKLTIGNSRQKLARTTLTAEAERGEIKAALRSGDMSLDFSSAVGIDSIAIYLSNTADVVMEQFRRRSIDMQQIQDALPQLRLEASAGTDNILHALMSARDVSFREVSAAVYTTASRPLSARLFVEGLRTNNITLDTLNVWARRQGDSLGYFVRLANRPGNIDKMAMIMVRGHVAGNKASASFLQNDRQKRTGFRFGLEAELLDSALQVRMHPYDPIFAYNNWTVNGDNYFRYKFDRGLYADMRLDGDNQHFHITSAGFGRVRQGAVRLDIAGIDIGETLGLLPSPPPVTGMLSADMMFGYDGDMLALSGKLGLDNLGYGGNRVGDIGLKVSLEADDLLQRIFNATVTVDNGGTITARGLLGSDDEGGINIKVGISSLQLSSIGAFIPADMATLAGSLNGDFIITGPASSPIINGDAGISGGRLRIPLTGTAFNVSEDRITVRDGRLDFNNFGLIAPNNNRLSLRGGVDMRDMQRITADISLVARDFRAVSSTWIGRSQVFGRADMDVNITARGPLNAMAVRGNVRLLRTTDVTYTMRSSPLEVDNSRRQDIVTFVVFADTAAMAARDSLPRAVSRRFGMDMLVSVAIDDGVQATVNLTETGSDRIELVGGGNLSYSMNVAGDTRFSGRYNLTGGTVVYSPPIISQKNFSIGTNSYVEWTGDIMSPTFNITGTESLRTTVRMEDGTTRNVTFNVIVMIRNTLQNMDVMFDLAAPGDITIQNQLASLTPEQRSQQAMALLVYNTYTGPGATARVDTNNPLNAFIEKELNQWARNNLKNIDLSFGINTVDDAITGSQHTNYSYRVSTMLFNDRVRVTIGGRVNSNVNATRNLQENLIDDITLEYRLTNRDNMYLKLYRYNTQESILEGEVVETGAGFLIRKNINKFGDLFRLRRDRRGERQYERWLQEGVRRQRESVETDTLNRAGATTADSIAIDTIAIDSPVTNEKPTRGQ